MTEPTNNPRPQLSGSEILWATLVGEGGTTVFRNPKTTL